MTVKVYSPLLFRPKQICMCVNENMPMHPHDHIHIQHNNFRLQNILIRSSSSTWILVAIFLSSASSHVCVRMQVLSLILFYSLSMRVIVCLYVCYEFFSRILERFPFVHGVCACKYLSFSQLPSSSVTRTIREWSLLLSKFYLYALATQCICSIATCMLISICLSMVCYFDGPLCCSLSLPILFIRSVRFV